MKHVKLLLITLITFSSYMLCFYKLKLFRSVWRIK